MDTLNMANVKTTNTQQLAEDEYLIRADLLSVPNKCPKCASTELWAFGTRSIRYVDHLLHGRKTLINLKRQRYRCQACKVTFYADNPEFDPEFRLTSRCAKWIEQEAIHKPFSWIATQIGVDDHVVRNVFRRYAHKKEKELEPVAGRVIGIDELHLVGQYRAIITNLEKRTVIDLLKTRFYPSVCAYLKKVEGREKIEVVCIDMWGPYKQAVQAALPKANLIVDKFHVAKIANECLDKIRKEYQSGLPRGAKLDLMRGRHILLRRSRDLNDEHKERLAVWRKSCPELADAYDHKERFFDIYDLRDPKAAIAAYKAWSDSLPLSISKAFKPLQISVRNWQSEIFSYFDTRFTNAYTECLNGMVKMTNRAGRGYSFDVIRSKLLFAHTNHKRAATTMRSRLNNMGVPF